MKTKYAELVKKHGLPAVNDYVFVEDETTIQEIRKAFAEKLYGFAETLDTILHPEGISAMVEAQVFSEEEQRKVEEFYNKVMLLGKDCMLVDIAASEAEEVQLIKQLCKEWPGLVKELKQIIIRSKDAYNGKGMAVHNVSYLG